MKTTLYTLSFDLLESSQLNGSPNVVMSKMCIHYVDLR